MISMTKSEAKTWSVWKGIKPHLPIQIFVEYRHKTEPVEAIDGSCNILNFLIEVSSVMMART